MGCGPPAALAEVLGEVEVADSFQLLDQRILGKTLLEQCPSMARRLGDVFIFLRGENLNRAARP